MGMWHGVAWYFLTGLGVMCWDLGAHTLQKVVEEHSAMPDDASVLSSLLWEVPLWPLILVIMIPFGLGVFVWRYLLGNQPPEDKEKEES